MTANEITKALLVEMPKRFNGDVVAWRNNRIDTMAVGRNGKPRRVQAGIDGQGDISGIACVLFDGRKVGIRIELEIKAGKDVMSNNQTGFQNMIRRHGGIYLVVRNVEQGLADLQTQMELVKVPF